MWSEMECPREDGQRWCTNTPDDDIDDDADADDAANDGVHCAMHTCRMPPEKDAAMGEGKKHKQGEVEGHR